jgi:hypothetical protein
MFWISYCIATYEDGEEKKEEESRAEKNDRLVPGPVLQSLSSTRRQLRFLLLWQKIAS